MKDFELAVSELLQMYRGRITKGSAIAALARQGEEVAADNGWDDPAAAAPEDQPADDPEAA